MASRAGLDRSPFVGRDSDLADLLQLANEAGGGHGSLVLVVGEAGIGKTRITEEAATRAPGLAPGFAVLWATCGDGDGAPAYWPWIQLLRAHAETVDDTRLIADLGWDARVVAALVPEIGGRVGSRDQLRPLERGLEVTQEQFRLFDAVVSVFRRVAVRQPLLVVLDDLQEADLPSLMLLRFLARELRTMRVLVIGSYRPVDGEHGGERARVLGELAHEGRVLSVPPLRVPDIAQLLTEVVDGPLPAETVDAVARRSRGNPLFVLELARVVGASGDPQAALAGVPERIRAVFDARLARLSDGCADLVSAAAVAGQDGAIEIVAAAAGLPPEETLRLIDEAVGAGLLRATAEGTVRYAFAHPLVREVLYERLSVSRRASLHRRIAEVLEAQPVPEERIAELAVHLVRAGPGGDPAKAVDYSRRAGKRSLAVLAYEDAAEHFGRALEVAALCPPDDAGRVGLLLALGDAKLGAGDLPAAREAFVSAAEISRRHGWAEQVARAALGFGAGLGGFEVPLFDRRQIDLLEEALAVLPPEDSSLRAWTSARLSVALSFVASQERRRALSEEAVAMARRIADQAALAYALASHCDAISGPTHTEQRAAEAAEIIRLAQLAKDPGAELLGRRLRLVALLELGDIGAADGEIDKFAATADALRQPLYLAYVPLWRAMRAVSAGRLVDAERLTSQAEHAGIRAHSVNAAINVSAARMTAAVMRGDVDRSLTILDGMIDAGLPLGASAEAFRVNFLAQRGEVAAARAGVTRLATDVAEREDAEWLGGMTQLAEAATVVGDDAAAEPINQALEPYAHRFVVDGIGSGWLGSVAHYLGLLATVRGDRAAAAGYLEQALAAHRAAGAPLLVARTLLAHADIASGVRADEMRREAHAIYAELGLHRHLPREGAPATSGTFRREGEYWTLRFAGAVARVKDSKGMRDIAYLLSGPGREVHALDLFTGGVAESVMDTGEVIDAQARRAYRARLADLEELIDKAELLNDPGRAEAARAEREALVAELAAAYGLGGRARRLGNPAERARSAVSWRIRDALARIDRVHPRLGRHLRNSLRTGTFCSYQPEDPVAWRL